MHAEADALQEQRLIGLSVLEAGETEALTEARNGNSYDVPQCDFALAKILLEARGTSKAGWRLTKKGLFLFTLDRWYTFPSTTTIVGAKRGPVDGTCVPTGVVAIKSAVQALGLESAIAFRSAVKFKPADGIHPARKARAATVAYKPLKSAPVAEAPETDPVA